MAILAEPARCRVSRMTGSLDLINREIMLLSTILPFLLAPGALSELPASSFTSEPKDPITTTTVTAPQDGEPEWVGKADFGLTYLSGNTESTTAAASAELKYDAALYAWLFSANYAGVRTSTAGNATTTSRLYATGGQYNRFMDEEKNLFYYGKASARKDVPVGLELRWDAGVGAGYTWYLSDDQKTFFSLEGGPSFVHEENVGSATEADAANARVAARYGNPLWDEWILGAKSEYFISLDETEDQSFTGELTLDWTMNEDWYLKFLAAVAWDNTPSAGFESTDRRFVIGVGTNF
jgi:putative salt-induced outer membrane protein YdiY